MSRALRFVGGALKLAFPIIKRYAFRRPHAHLYDRGELRHQRGALYMGRWHIVKAGTWQSRVLQLLTRGRYKTIRLHRICRPDHDRELHNHPFEYLTFILEGFYSEYFEHPRYGAERKYRTLFSGNHARGEHETFHRISDVSPNGVWTFFMMSENTETWGFKTDKGFVNSVRYLLRKGYNKDDIRDLKLDSEQEQ